MALLDGFFSDDVDAALAAVAALEKGGPGAFDRSFGRVDKTDTHTRDYRDKGRFRLERGGIFAAQIFGPDRDYECNCGQSSGRDNEGKTCERCGVLVAPSSLRAKRFGHVEVKHLVHPLAYRALGEAARCAGEDLRNVAHGEVKLSGDDFVRPDQIETEGIGPAVLTEWLRAKVPDHPALALCDLTMIPIPPPAQRPMVSGLAPTMVDPWIGPLNAQWVSFVDRANRYLRLLELDAPQLILVSEQIALQQALEVLVASTAGPPKLVPPLARPPAADEREHMLRVAWADDRSLVLQQPSSVSVVTIDGATKQVCPASACELRGVTAEGIALFHGFFGHLHPHLAEEHGFDSDFVKVDEEGVRHVRPHLELSALDLASGRYLVDAPKGVPRAFILNDEPEDLFLQPDDGPAQKLRVGADRPHCFAYTTDLRFGWAGETGAGTAVFDLATAIPHVSPLEPDPRDPKVFDLRTGEQRDAEDGDEPESVAGTAVAFAGGEWRFVWDNGLYSDHCARRVLRLHPLPRAAAFDATGAKLALVADDHVYVVDVAAMRVVSRFPLPSTP